MTATTATPPFDTKTASAGLVGLRPLVRKERIEWLRGRRAWVVAVVVTLFTALQAVAAWVNDALRRAYPSPDAVPTAPVSMDPLDNLIGAVSSQAYLFVAVFALAGILLKERDDGTLAWVASKPVGRAAIWVSKWLNASLMLAISAVAVPLSVTTGLVAVLYGTPEFLPVVALALGMAGVLVFFAAAALALGTVVPSQAAVAGLLLGLLLLPAIVDIIPIPLTQFLPHSILPWAIGAATGADVGVVAPIAWLIGTGILVALGIRRLESLEL